MKNSDIGKGFFKNRFLQVVIHMLAWGLFLGLLTSLVPKPPEMSSFLSILIPDIFFVSFFYFNFFYLVPKYFIPKKYIMFGLFSLSFLILTITVPSMILEYSQLRPSGPEFREMPDFRPGPDSPAPKMPEPDRQRFDNPGFPGPGMKEPPGRIIFFNPEFSYTIFVFLFILTLSTGIRIHMRWQQTEKEKVDAELSFLKAQINPHFLFNTLNNIYSMAVNKEDKTPEAIEMFSGMMRFVIQETRNAFVPLSAKLGYIDTYIDLQKLRLPSTVNVNFIKKGDPGDLLIAPLILLPFIENAFKYGVSAETETDINIILSIEDGGLDMLVNNFKLSSPKTFDDTGQIGIENTIKRLQLIYPGKHRLKITDTADEYTVTLHIDLK